MATKNLSTEAVHLTSLDLEISNVTAKLNQIKQETEATAAQVRQTMQNAFNTTSTDGKPTNAVTESAKASVSAFENLTLSYKNFVKTLSQTKLTGDQISILRSVSESAAKEVSNLTKEVISSGKASEQQVQSLQQYNSLLKQLKGSLSDVATQANKTGENLTLGQSVSQIQNVAKSVLQLQSSYSSFFNTIAGSKVPESALGTMPLNIKYTIGEIQQLSAEISKNGTITQSQSEQIAVWQRNLIQARTTLSQLEAQLKLSNAQMEEQARQAKQSSIPYDELAKSVDSLSKKFTAFQNHLKNTKLTQNALGDLPKQAEEAKRQLDQLQKSMLKNGTATKDQEKKFASLTSELGRLKAALNTVYGNAIRTGTGFRDIGESARTGTTLVSDFVNKLSDKIKWFAAYQVITLVRNAFYGLVGTIKETEDAVVQLQRVLNSDIASTELSDALYSIAQQYGQTFQNVQEVAVLFAQTGLEWQDVISATEATMLALNTAELEVSSATSGLIAIMAQFGIEAADMESVIDKINITADNFAVTSESIVAALQRAGGTASAYNLTLEETVGVITALAEATGRSGEALGTALNSLITFSMKDSSLQTFSDYLGMDVTQGYDALEVWSLLATKISDSREELAAMMASSEEFQELFTEDLANAIGLTEEYNAALANSQDVYSAVGTYRQNYFIALLNNIQTAIEAVEGMTDAQGYSVKENKDYMETLTSQYNQLVIAAQELAVQFGEEGFLDTLKLMSQLGIEVLKVTKDFGGLKTVLMAIVALIATVKAEKIKTFFLNTASYVQRATNSMITFSDSMVSTGNVVQSLKTSISTMNFSLSAAIGIIGASITVVSAITAKIEAWKEEMKAARQETIKLGQTSADEAKNIYNAYKAFIDAGSMGYENQKTATTALLESLGYEYEDISFLEDQYGDLNNAIKVLIKTKYELLKANAEIAKQDAELAFQDIEPQFDFSRVQAKELEYIQPYLLEANINMDSLNKMPKTYDELIEKMRIVKDLYDTLTKSLSSSERETSQTYTALAQLYSDLYDAKTVYDKADEDLKMYGETYEETMQNIADSISRADEAIGELGNTSSITIESLNEQLESISEAYDTLSAKIDAFQSAYSTLNSVMEEYNETGIFTADMLQSLLNLEPEYISMLQVSANTLSIKSSATGELVSTQDIYMQQLAALRIEEYATQIQTDALTAANQNLTLSEYYAANGANAMGGEIYSLALQFLQGKISSSEFANSLGTVSGMASIASSDIQLLKEQVSDYANTLSSLFSVSDKTSSGINKYYTPTVQKVDTSEQDKQKERIEKEKQALEDEIELWEKKREEVSDYYDAQIEALKEVQESNDRINEQLDYYNNRQEVITNLEQARSRSGVEYRQKEMEYQQELIDLEDDWNRQLEDWNIEDQIEKLEELKEKSVEEIANVIEQLREQISALSEEMSSSISTGASSGLSYASESTGSFVQNFSDAMDALTDKSEQSAKAMYENYHNIFLMPLQEGLEWVMEYAQQKNVENSYKYAQLIMEQYRQGLINPLQQELESAMIKAGQLSDRQFAFPSYSQMMGTQPTWSNTNNVNMFANIANTSAANATTKALSSIFDYRFNPTRFPK